MTVARGPELRRILVPAYMKRFSCIGGNCEDTCCQGWRVDVDRITYHRYRTVTHKKWQLAFRKHIQRNPDRPSPARWAVIKLDKQGMCPFLTDEGLCGVQLDLGPDALCNVCATFPRNRRWLGAVLELTTTLACPEMARVALLDPEGIEFDDTAETVDRRSDQVGEFRQNNDLWPARLLGIRILQERQYSISERLVGLGLLCQALEDLGSERQESQVMDVVNRFTRLAASGSLKQSIPYDERHDQLQMAMLMALLWSGYGRGLMPKQRELVTEFLKGIEYVEGMTVSALTQNMANLRDRYWRDFERTYEYILENYLVHEAYRIGLPLHPGPFDAFAHLILGYALFVFQLIGLSGYHQGITPELAVRVAYCEARKIQHGRDTVKRMVEWLKENNTYNLATLTILAH